MENNNNWAFCVRDFDKKIFFSLALHFKVRGKSWSSLLTICQKQEF